MLEQLEAFFRILLPHYGKFFMIIIMEDLSIFDFLSNTFLQATPKVFIVSQAYYKLKKKRNTKY